MQMRGTASAGRGRAGAALAALALVSSSPATAARALEVERAETAQDEQERPERKDEIERLSAWPRVADAAAVARDVERLRKARTEEMAILGREGLLEAGAGAAPALLDALAKEKDQAALARIASALEALTGAAHTRLLAREFAARSERVRTFCLRRVARFADPGVRVEAEKALQAARRRAARAPEDSDAAFEVFAAGLCCASAGSPAGLDAVAAMAESDWSKVGAEVRAALEPLRGRDATRMVGALLSEQGREKKLAGLRLLAGCGTREDAVPLVRPHLDSEDNALRIAAINALRGIFDGDPPLERLAVFDAIELARRWKERL